MMNSLTLTEASSLQTSGQHEAGLTIPTTCVFVVGILAGSGFLAIPKSIDDAGLTGIVFLVGFCGLCMYTATILSRCWTILQDRGLVPCQGQARHPYPAMAYALLGKYGRYVVTIALTFTNFGTVVVYILLSSENLVILISPFTDLSFCYVCVIVAVILTPVTWLGSPKDFWGTALAATLATGTASLLILANIFKDKPDHPTVVHSEITFVSFFTAFGTMGFSYGGHPVFPTVLADMKRPRDFGKAVVVGYTIVLFIYIPCGVASYFIYGNDISANILESVSDGWLRTTATILMTSHLLFAVIFVMNPVSQEVEHLLNIPSRLTWKRILSRAIMMLAALFVAETVPHFAAILALVGGSSVTLVSFILPSVFYLKLARTVPGPEDKWEPFELPLHVKVMNVEIMMVGILAGMAATYSAITDLVTSSFSVPCYVSIGTARL